MICKKTAEIVGFGVDFPRDKCDRINVLGGDYGSICYRFSGANNALERCVYLIYFGRKRRIIWPEVVDFRAKIAINFGFQN